jgi:outer membrane beta-barrel protein
MEPAMKQWFLHSGNEQIGPLTEAEIRKQIQSGQITSEHHAWCEGMGDWKKIADIGEFRLTLAPASAPAKAPASMPPAPSMKAKITPRNIADHNDLSALIEMPKKAHKKEDPTVFLDLKSIKKAKKAVHLAEKAERAEMGGKIKIWKLLLLVGASIILLAVVMFATMNRSHADDTASSQSQPDSGQRMDVENLKHKYWAQGEEDELRVVQNRRYSKTHKLELGFMGGFVSNDPFLSVHAIGGSLSYYLSENVAVGVVGWKYMTSNSSAMTTLQQTLNTTANTNPPRDYLGVDLKWSPLYGKLSLLGESIIYYDIYLIGGGGETNTASGTEITPTFGIGSQIYLSHSVLLQLTYYQQVYSETVPNQIVGAPSSTRSNWNSAVMVGFNFLVF